MSLGVVYLGEQFVEVPDSTVTLHDIYTSFGLMGDMNGVHLRNRMSARVVATLPFESLPPLSSLEGDEDNTYDLILPTNAADADPTTDEMTGILQQLVQLGAASMLTMSPQTKASLELYDPHNSPGWLTRRMYPPSIYSPYRGQIDPIDGTAPIAIAAARLACGAPYRSGADAYDVEEATWAARRRRPDLTVQSEEEAKRILDALTAAGAWGDESEREEAFVFGKREVKAEEEEEGDEMGDVRPRDFNDS